MSAREKRRWTTPVPVAGTLALLLGLGGAARADHLILDDLIVDGSQCLGFDCVNGESFGYDTLRLKENNLRIRFMDTSTISGYPSRDWQITANDSASGGANKFSIDDIDGGRTPFTIEAGAPTHSLYVDDGGRLGLGTSTPTVELHVVDGDSPTLRLQQDGSSGFDPQSWDVVGNETNFFVRDVTHGSALPLRIRPGAPSNSIYISSDGDVGIGTSAPDAGLEVRRSTGGSATLLQLTNNSTVNYVLSNSASGVDWNVGTFGADNFAISRVGSGINELVVRTGGDVEVPQGTVVHSSSRRIKTEVTPVDPRQVLERVAELPLATWRYDRGRAGEPLHLGPMAEDFHAAFGLGADDRGIAFSDTAGVALAAIQGLYDLVRQRDETIVELARRNADLAERLARLETSRTN